MHTPLKADFDNIPVIVYKDLVLLDIICSHIVGIRVQTRHHYHIRTLSCWTLFVVISLVSGYKHVTITI